MREEETGNPAATLSPVKISTILESNQPTSFLFCFKNCFSVSAEGLKRPTWYYRICSLSPYGVAVGFFYDTTSRHLLVLPKSTTSSWESFICYHNVLFYRKMVKIIYNGFQIKETKPGNNWYSYIKELYQCPCPQLSVYSFPHLTLTWLNWLLSAFHLLAKQIENNYAHAQYYDCLRHCFLNMHQLIWGQHYWVLSQSPWAPRNYYLDAKKILFMIIFLLPQFSKQEFEQLVLHNSKLGGKMSSWILLLACTCGAGALRFAYYFTNSGAHNQLLVNKIITENKIVPSDFNNLKIKKERRKKAFEK